MLPIGSTIPVDSQSLRAALARALGPIGVAENAITVEGEFPQIAAIRADLTGANFYRGVSLPKAAPQRTQLCFARQVAVEGQPVSVEGLPLSVNAEAADVIFATADQTSGGGRLLLIERAESGSLELAMKREDIESALRAAGHKAAQAKGAEVKSVDVTLQGETPRSLNARVVITAKAMFMTTAITVSGRIEVDAEMNARLRDLRCDGEGMIGNMVAGLIRPQFSQLEQRVIALGRLVPGITIHDVTLSGGDELRLRAKFRATA